MTSSFEFAFRTHILDMPAYEPILPLDVLSERLGIPQEKIVKLDANENPYGPLPEVRSALANLDQVHIYPDPESRRIRALLADHHGISPNSIVVGAGADELIDLIMRLTIDPGDRLINCLPTFGMYAFDAAVNQAQVIDVPRLPDFTVDADALQGAIRAHAPKLLFLANPNNPDGQLIAAETIRALLDLPVLVVLDEAYIDFSAPSESWIGQVVQHENLIVLRTFSKWAGLAGLRIGYGVFPERFVPLFMKAKQPYNVSVAAEEAACVSMANVEKVQRVAARIVEERRRLFDRLAQLPWLNPYPSSANFILCKVIGKEAASVKQALRSQGILIRHFDKPGLRDHIRISVGRPEQTGILIDALERME